MCGANMDVSDAITASVARLKGVSFDQKKVMAIVETESMVSKAIAAPAFGQIKSLADEVKDVKDSIPGVEGKLRREIRDTDLGLREAGKDLREEIKDMGAGLRKEIRDVDARLREVGAGLRKEIKDVDAGLRKEIKDVDAGLREEIKDLGAEMREADKGLRAEINSMSKHHVIMILGFLGVIVAVTTPFIVSALTNSA